MHQAEIDDRFDFHPANSKERQDEHRTTRSEFKGLAEWANDSLPEGREKSLVITKLEEALFWANAAIARQK